MPFSSLPFCLVFSHPPQTACFAYDSHLKLPTSLRLNTSFLSRAIPIRARLAYTAPSTLLHRSLSYAAPVGSDDSGNLRLAF